MWHNESYNVWSHLIGALIFMYFGFYIMFYMQPPTVHIINFDSNHVCSIKEHEFGKQTEQQCFLESFEKIESEVMQKEPLWYHSMMNTQTEKFERM